MSHRNYPGLQYGAIPEVIGRVTADVDVVNTTTSTFLSGISVPANAMGTDRAVWFHLIGDYLNNSGASRALTLTIMFGGSVLWQDSTLVLPVSTTRRALNIQLMLMNQGSASAQGGGGTVAISGVGGASPGLGDIGAAETFNVPITFATITEATNADKTFMVLATHPVANANLSVRALSALALLL